MEPQTTVLCFELKSGTLKTCGGLSLFVFLSFYFLSCSYVQSACKIFKAAEECRLDRDEEKSYVLYMKYLTVYDIIKKRPDFKQHPVNMSLNKLTVITFLYIFVSHFLHLNLNG